MNFHEKRFQTILVESKDNEIYNDNTTDTDNDDNNNNRTLIVGPCFCGTSHLMMNRLVLSESDNPARKMKFLTRSPNQYPDNETSDSNLSLDDYKDCVVVFDDMLDHKEKEICPVFTNGRHVNFDVYFWSQRFFYFTFII